MSTLAGETPSQILTSRDDLLHYFDAYVKPPKGVLLGLEAEFLPVHARTGRSLPYQGKEGIEAILRELAAAFGYQPILDEGHVIALKRADRFVALEPGGQTELSAAPVSNVFEIQDQIHSFVEELHQINSKFPEVRWLSVGIHPFSGLEEVPWVPKTRYRIMSSYMKDRGSQSHDMMKRTATDQLNIDYLNEEDAMEKLRTILGLSSIVTAIFANSSFSEGKPNGFATQRLDIWNHTDPDRAGLLIEFTHKAKTFEDYLRYILEMPMIFILRQGKWIATKGIPFQKFIEEGFQGTKATLGDFELHLSTAFPEARIKQFIEIRGVDAQSPDLIPAVAAFWKGILYDTETREKAWQLVDFATDKERIQLHHEVPKKGLKATLGSKPILPMARELVDLSCKSLARQTNKSEKRDECVFLKKICEQITTPGKSPGEILLEKWHGDWGEDPAKLIDYLSI